MATAKEQKAIAAEVRKTEETYNRLKNLLGNINEENTTLLSTSKDIAREIAAQVDADARLGKIDEARARTGKTLVRSVIDYNRDLREIIKGTKTVGDLEVLRAEAIKEGDERTVKQIDRLKKLRNITKVVASGYQKGAEAVDSIASKIKSASPSPCFPSRIDCQPHE